MENNNFVNDDWVDSRLATLESDAAPDTARALDMLRRRQVRGSTVRQYWTWAATAAAICTVALLALPGTRATAQRLWDSLFLKRVDIVRVNFDDIPENLRSLRADIVTGPGKVETVPDAAEAERKAGFRPNLVGAFVLRGTPKLSVISAIGARLTIRRHELSTALARARASDIEVPQSWERASVGVTLGPMVQADYQDMSLVQCRPPLLVTPPDFDTPRLVEIAFRILGMDKQKASTLSKKFAANPAWFFGIPEDEQVTIEEIALRSGPGVYLEDFDDRGQLERVTVIWSTSDRAYLLSGTNRDLAIHAANSIR